MLVNIIYYRFPCSIYDIGFEKHFQFILCSFEDCQKPSNALLIVRCICKYLIDKLPEQELIRQFNTLPSCEGMID